MYPLPHHVKLNKKNGAVLLMAVRSILLIRFLFFFVCCSLLCACGISAVCLAVRLVWCPISFPLALAILIVYVVAVALSCVQCEVCCTVLVPLSLLLLFHSGCLAVYLTERLSFHCKTLLEMPPIYDTHFC